MINEPIPFLANVAAAAYADGHLSPSELGQLEAIRNELGFKKGDFNKAINLVEKGQHQVTPVGTFADQVKNLELMLRVAYSDDDLSDTESSLISDFCHRIGINQDQLIKMVNEALASLKQQGKLCHSCGTSASNDASFCPKCGTSLNADSTPVLVEFKIPATGLAIEFSDSTAASFPQALEFAKSASSYQTCQKLKKTWHLAIYSSGSLQEALPLAAALSSIRNKRIYLDGTENSWDDLFGFAWCASQRSLAYNANAYCFGKDENRINPWGCKQARMDWAEWADWFSYGSWEKSTMRGVTVIWRFNKDQIRHELANNVHHCRFCPHVIPGLSDAVLRYLPDTVAPEIEKDWTFNHHYEETPGSIKIIQKEAADGFSYQSEYWSNGVRPKGLKQFAEILEKALSDIGNISIKPRALI